MTVFWLLIGLLILIALAILLPPLWRQRTVAAADMDSRNIAIAKTRLAELQAQLATGALTEEQYQEQRAELELALADDLDIATGNADPDRHPICRCDLGHALLMPALQGAITLAHMDHIAEAVPEHLDLDVPGIRYESLEIEGVVAEGRTCLGRSRSEHLLHVAVIGHDLHASPAAACGCLQHEWKTDAFRSLHCLCKVSYLLGPGEDRQAVLAGERPGLKFVAHLTDLIGSGPYKRNALRRARFRQFRRLGQKSIARMDCVRSGRQGSCDNGFDVQVAFGGAGRAYADGAAGNPCRQTVPIGIRDSEDGLDSQRLAGADNADGDFTAVGDQNAGDCQLRPPLPAPFALPRSGSETVAASRTRKRKSSPCWRR